MILEEQLEPFRREDDKWTFMDYVLAYFVACGVIFNLGIGVFLCLLFYFG